MMPARPFHPEMERRRVHGGWHAAGFVAALVCATWAGAHGYGPVVGAVLAVAALVAILVALVVGGSWFAGWAVREIRGELAAARLGGQVGDTPLTPAERTRRWRAGESTRIPGMHPNGDVDVECWCRAEVVTVRPEVVRAARTESCGRARCDELAKEASS